MGAVEYVKERYSGLETAQRVTGSAFLKQHCQANYEKGIRKRTPDQQR